MCRQFWLKYLPVKLSHAQRYGMEWYGITACCGFRCCRFNIVVAKLANQMWTHIVICHRAYSMRISSIYLWLMACKWLNDIDNGHWEHKRLFNLWTQFKRIWISADISKINRMMISSTHRLYLGSPSFNLIYSYTQWNEASSQWKGRIPTIIVCVFALSMRLCPRDFRLPNYHYAKTKAVLYF